MNVYHWCLVPECKNTSVKTPKKLWIQLPMNMKMRNIWLKLAGRDPTSLSTKSKLYFCEDHFDLENDMENYTEYKIMGSVKRIRMKPNCVPTRFDCHVVRKQNSTSPEPYPIVVKNEAEETTEHENDIISSTTDELYIKTEIEETIEYENDVLSFCSKNLLTSEVENDCHLGRKHSSTPPEAQRASIKTEIEETIENENDVLLIPFRRKDFLIPETGEFNDKAVQVAKPQENKGSQDSGMTYYRSTNERISTSNFQVPQKKMSKLSKSTLLATKRKQNFAEYCIGNHESSAPLAKESISSNSETISNANSPEEFGRCTLLKIKSEPQ